MSGLPGRIYRLDVTGPEGRHWWERLGGRLTPLFVILDGEGEVVYRAEGRPPEPGRVRRLLDAAGPGPA